jgi:hypothetical protein
MRAFTVMGVLALAACDPSAEQPGQTREAANGCPAAAASSWTADDGVVFIIGASAIGADCAQANAALSIQNAAGETVLNEAYPVDEVMTLAGAESVEDMQRRLAEWINPAGAGPDSTGDLPEWVQGEDNPMSGEFPFYVEAGMGRAGFEALRARDLAMFCYEQGMESVACLAVDNGELKRIGLQTFPG